MPDAARGCTPEFAVFNSGPRKVTWGMEPNPDLTPPRCLVLIGFMGSGKTTIGRRLQEQLGYPLLDTDHLIEERQGKSIREIFADEGEDAFRDMESSLLEELAAEPMTSRIISTGGGIIGRAANCELLRRLGFVVWLKAPAEEIGNRTARNSTRPLLQNDDPAAAIAQLMTEREPCYRATAHLELETADLDVDEVCTGILECASYHFTRSS